MSENEFDNDNLQVGETVACVKPFTDKDGRVVLELGKSYKITNRHADYNDVQVNCIDRWWGNWFFERESVTDEMVEETRNALIRLIEENQREVQRR